MAASETLTLSLTANFKFQTRRPFCLRTAGSVEHCRCQIEDGCQSLSSQSSVLSLSSSLDSLSPSLIRCLFCPLLTSITAPLSALSKLYLHIFFSRLPHHSRHSHITKPALIQRIPQVMVFFIPKGQISSTEVDCHSKITGVIIKCDMS